jgi:23S rRNA (uracil1939-C5)-methyltransferase
MVGHTLKTAAPQVVASPRPAGHRARIKLAIEGGRLGYRRPRSHDLVEVEVCRIARPEVHDAHLRLAAWLRDHPDNMLTAVELRSDGERVVYAFEGRARGLEDLGDVAIGGRSLHGDPSLVLEVDGLGLRAGPSSFYQVNLEVNALLAAHVRAAVRARAPERVLDLYAGIGNLSLPLAAAGLPVVAVEAPGPGATDLAFNARAIPHATVVAARVERFDPTVHAFDMVILDPPRAGAPGVLGRITRQRPRLIVYVSCHAPSAARDLKALEGYRISDVTCFDLFPDTHHIETVVLLERV